MARYSETRAIALRMAFSLTVFMILLVLLGWFLIQPLKWWHMLMMLPLMFGFSFVFVQKTMDQYVYKKIKLIYKTIGAVKNKPSKGMPKAKSYESLEGVNQAMIEWSKRQKNEIKELKKLAVYRREFLGNISHELKTPIFNIQGYVLTLLDGGLEDENINRNYLMRTEKSINRLIAIVEDLEEISKLESGELKLNLQRFDLSELSRDVVEFLEMKAQRYNAKVVIDKQPEKPAFVQADKKRIRQVLINLIENAIKYGNKAENMVSIRIFDMDEKFLIEIKDNGPGISELNLPRIFERFYRVDKGRSRDSGGTGLGLAIVKHIVEAHEQSITVRSKLEEGTTFAFTLEKSK
ncbi:MAG: GHKL domain-containing protein [Bacteroidetes bacterium]|nr:GHKL domain-containing protein [Bacteroidota bacterium]MBU1577796.1 GHKL domain-containing protein [Bacteroidota bacterium]MBU2558756.1 GHKL domain-containing protein [Bacteroidota bacterium]